MSRRLRDSVIVVTGASSGIGRATALAFARKGATLVLAARREEELRKVAQACRQLGGQALVVPTDVTDEQAVLDLGRAAIEHYGHLEVWVNNAAMILFARIEQAPMDDYRRVMETNLLGYVHGARTAIRYFREQGEGVLINNSSVHGTVGAPYLSAYVATKFAIRGLSECLREEVLDAPRIHVCTLLPASIDTPLFQHAANYTGRAVKPLEPLYSAEAVAAAVVRLARKPRREMMVGTSGRGLRLLRGVLPSLAEKMMAGQVERDHFQDRPSEPTSGNLHEPWATWDTVSGGWNGRHRGRRRAWVTAGVAGALITASVVWRIARGDGSSGGSHGCLSSTAGRMTRLARRARGARR